MSMWHEHRTRSSESESLLGLSPRLQKASNHDESNWLLTYSDMVTLLLAFFIIIASVSVPSEERYRIVQESIAQKLGVTKEASERSKYVNVLRHDDAKKAVVALTAEESLGGKTLSGDAAPANSKTEQLNPELPVEMVQVELILNALSEVIQDQGLSQQVSVTKYGSAATVTFPEGVFFDSGDARFSKQAAPFLEKVAVALKSIETPFVVEVEGHTDNRPIIKNKSQYPTNWELSTARATQVVRFLLNKGLKPDQLVAKGFADTRPIANEQQKNRRVVLKIIAADKEIPHGN